MLCYNLPPRGDSMANLSSIMKQLKKERDRVEKQTEWIERGA
jgi:hypothetical protein